MQLQEALNLVQQKFQAESKGETSGEAADKYQAAFADYPVMMEVATHIFGSQIILQNAQQQAARAQQAAQAATTGAPIGNIQS
ncbi:hypothetical protein [Mucisphaera sp.]|uniref:hypothetical protein n=1 Tax=Mucisphaera sp. TaxID=2913024 RepID=UPI003D11E83E